MADRGQRTEKPTAKRLERAREQGNLPKSQEVPGALVLGAFFVFAHVAGPGWLARLKAFVGGSVASIAQPDLTTEGLSALSTSIAAVVLTLLAAPLGTVLAAGLTGHLVQNRPVFTLKPLAPSARRLNPVNNLRRVFSLSSWFETTKGGIKLALYAWVGWNAARSFLLEPTSAGAGAEGAFAALAGVGGTIVGNVFVLAFGLAVIDVLFRRYDYVRGLRMTKQEVREEHREHEGDPLIKARLRSRQMTLARTRMMAEVPKASVVVTNPTHYAVALTYVHGETPVPKVVAKGRGKIALRIREIARESGVPVVEDPPLARLLYKAAAVGSEIPPALYHAVAGVLALVLKGAGRRPAPAPSPEAHP